jgi:glycosyltransferase involved in cell wall biosynthesis
MGRYGMHIRSGMVISIVTPSYNQGQFIAETIESVISQDGNFFLDYIIVDGGSTDSSITVIKKYEALLASKEWVVRCNGVKFRWLSERDEGQTDAIMKGFRLAEGEVLAWLNSDDTYTPGAIQRLVDYLRAVPDASIVYGKTHFVSEAGKMIGSYPTRPFDAELLPVFNFISQPSVFFRRRVLDEVGGLDLTLQYVMDYDFWIRASRVFTFCYLDDYLSTYRLHQESKTISYKASLGNNKEALDTVVRHYNWAPISRVYVYCRQVVRARLHVDSTIVTTFLSIIYSLFKYLTVNKRIRFADIKMINKTNVKRASQGLMDIYREY